MSIFTVLGIIILIAQAVHMVAEMVNYFDYLKIKSRKSDGCEVLPERVS